MLHDDHRVAEAKAKGMTEVMRMLELTGLQRHGVEWVGPCPHCGGTDRFGINTRKGQFLCRRCGGKGDVIGLVMFVRGIEFKAALDWLCGPKQEISAKERAERDRRAAENAARKDREAAQFRARALAEAREMWQAAQAQHLLIWAYLEARGITRHLLPVLPVCLRLAPSLPYMVANPDAAGATRWIEAHRGPAMIAAVQGQDGKLCAVHRTWFDLAQPQGKARILHPVTGEAMPRKKIWGSKKGGAIRLRPNPDPAATTLVMGEGIETTLTAAVAGVWPEAHFWAGVDLGNMSGQRASGKGMKFAGLPDLDDGDAFLPPPWVTRLIFIKDGDSDPRDTRAKLEAGLRRAMLARPGLRGQIAACPPGKDLNDLLLDGDA
jgi:hypothetical protein